MLLCVKVGYAARPASGHGSLWVSATQTYLCCLHLYSRHMQMYAICVIVRPSSLSSLLHFWDRMRDFGFHYGTISLCADKSVMGQSHNKAISTLYKTATWDSVKAVGDGTQGHGCLGLPLLIWLKPQTLMFNCVPFSPSLPLSPISGGLMAPALLTCTYPLTACLPHYLIFSLNFWSAFCYPIFLHNANGD